MVTGIGIDIVEVNRLDKAIAHEPFVERVFTPDEVRYCRSRGKQAAQSFAARFAGKEAILKAFGTGLRGGSLHLKGYFADFARKKGVKNIWLSLTHTKEYAAAQCVMEAEDENSNK